MAERVQDLSIIDHWKLAQYGQSSAGGFDVSTIQAGFPLHTTRTFTQVLGITSNLSTVILLGVELSSGLIRNISNLHLLHTLVLRLCFIPIRVQSMILRGVLPPFRSVYNLELVCTGHWSLWCALPLCPHLRTLSAMGRDLQGIGLPPAALWSRCDFSALERFHLAPSSGRHMPILTSWLYATAKGRHLRLTHFKIYTTWCASDDLVFQVLDALRSAPLRVLVFEGIAEARLALFDHIAGLFPDLVALTVIRHPNNVRQRSARMVPWPYTSGEYARSFTAFTRLEHFAWNFRLDYLDSSPSLLLRFEEESLPGPPADHGAREKESDILFDDNHLLALPFAAHCPSLRTFAVFHRASPLMACRITRSQTGAISLDPAGLFSFNPWGIDRWNPDTKPWPLVLPVL